jgi:hypothetical protein
MIDNVNEFYIHENIVLFFCNIMVEYETSTKDNVI